MARMRCKPGPTESKNQKNNEAILEERRSIVAKLYTQGKTQWEIARSLNISQGTVSGDLLAIRDMWKASALVDFDEKKQLELARIDTMEQVAWEAWYRSCENAEFERHKEEEEPRAVQDDDSAGQTNGKKRGKKDTPVKRELVVVKRTHEKTSKGQTGDVRFLERVCWCIETRLKIMGLFKPDTNVLQMINISWDSLYKRQNRPDPVEERIAQVLRTGEMVNASEDVIDAPEPPTSHIDNGGSPDDNSNQDSQD